MVRDLCSKRTAADKIMNKMNENRKIVLDTLNEQNIEYEMFEHQAVYTVDEIEDSDLWNHENGIGAKNSVHPNDNTATIWMKLADLVNVIKLHGNQVKFINVE